MRLKAARTLASNLNLRNNGGRGGKSRARTLRRNAGRPQGGANVSFCGGTDDLLEQSFISSPAPGIGVRRALRGAFLSILLLSGAPTALAGDLANPATDAGALLLADAMRAADANKWDDAASLAARAPDPLVRTLVAWRRLLDEGGDWEALSGFLAAHPGWPREARIRALAERAMPDNLSARAVLAFFEGRSPISGGGALKLADALTDAGREAEARDLIRETWAATPMGEADRTALEALVRGFIAQIHFFR